MSSTPTCHNFLLSAHPGSVTTEACATDYTLSSILQDYSSTLHLDTVSDTDRLSTATPWLLALTPEELDCYVVAHVAHVIKQDCIHQGGLANIDLVFQATSWRVAFITDDHFLRGHYFWLTIHYLYPHITQWHDLIPQTSSATTQVMTPALSTSSSFLQSSEALSAPSVTSDIPIDKNVPRPKCDDCQRTFSRMDAWKRHRKRHCTYNKGNTFQHVFSAVN